VAHILGQPRRSNVETRVSGLPAWQAARVEVNQDIEVKARAEEDIAGDVVEQVIEKTDIDRA
jgi:hypothetical protein